MITRLKDAPVCTPTAICLIPALIYSNFTWSLCTRSNAIPEHMSRRFFAEHPIVGETLVLSDEQAHHIANVMRFKPGEQVVLFDGSGSEYSAELEEVGKKKVTLRVFFAGEPVEPPARRLTLAVALPKGDRQKFLIEKLVELGVSKFLPLKAVRSVSRANENVIMRMEKQVIEACKQCGRNSLMQIGPEQSLAQLITAPLVDEVKPLFAIASPDAPTFVTNLSVQHEQPIVVAIGPEGGFEQQEFDQAVKSGWQPVSLGPAVLRIETAAIAVATLLGIGGLGSCRP